MANKLRDDGSSGSLRLDLDEGDHGLLLGWGFGGCSGYFDEGGVRWPVVQ